MNIQRRARGSTRHSVSSLFISFRCKTAFASPDYCPAIVQASLPFAPRAGSFSGCSIAFDRFIVPRE
jgi:hypothetical protein